MSDLYEIIESEFDLIDDSNESELLEFNFMPIKKAVFKLISDHKKLQAENAELKKQGRWISVEDGVPELNKTVMIDSGSGFDFARFNGDYWTRKAWPLGYTPKYWISLPAQPKGE